MSKRDLSLKTIKDLRLTHKRVILRVDFNVSLMDGLSIADDARIRQSLPTITYLLKRKNKLILISHLGQPERRDLKYSLAIVAKHLKSLVPGYGVTLVGDFLSPQGLKQIESQKENEILMLENIRFYPGEKKNDLEFAKELAQFGDIYVNDAFGVSHRSDASIVSLPKFLPSYTGLLLKKEIDIISSLMKRPKKPFVAIIGGAKVSTKINLLSKLIGMVDYLLVGGALVNTFLLSKGHTIGKGLVEASELSHVKKLLVHARKKHTEVILPDDVVVGLPQDKNNGGQVVKVENIPHDLYILDIGPETQAVFSSIINKAKTIVWNGPVGYWENPVYSRGSDFLYYSITQNDKAFSLVGGGDTLAAISKKEYLEKITHISTGGGAMLEFIEKGTLPGIEALRSKD